jgi:hypothetical protein
MEQFAAEDKAKAAYLVDTLELVSTEAMVREMRKLVNKIVVATDGPLGLYACRKLPKGVDTLFDLEGEYLKDKASGHGSEDIVSNAILQMVRLEEAERQPGKKSRFLDHPSLDEISKHRVRRLVVINDLAGTGQQTVEFIRAMFNNKRLLAWWSRSYFDLGFAAYATTDAAFAAVHAALPGHAHPRRNRRIGRLITKASRVMEFGRWAPGVPKDVLRELRDLCVKYAKQASLSLALGYESSFLNLVFEHTAPDNLPGILRLKSRSWSPLFRERVVPDELVPCFREAQPEQAEKRAVATLSARAAKAIETVTPLYGVRMMLVLYAARRAIRSSEAIAHLTGLSQEIISSYQEAALDQGLLSTAGYLTKDGRAELRALERRGFSPIAPKELTDEPYVPISFRAG